MRHAQTLGISAQLAFLSLLFLGCGTNTTPSRNLQVPTSSHSWSDEEDATAGTVYRVGTLFVIWTDSPNGGGGNVSSNAHGITFQGRLVTCDRGHVEFSGESADGRLGTAIVDGVSYRLDDGNLFLVSTDASGLRVRQLKRDLKDLKFERIALQELANTDPEIKDFFANDREFAQD